MDANEQTIAELTTNVVVSFVANHQLSPAELIGLIEQVHGTFNRLSSPQPEEVAPVKPVPAVPIRKSITPDYIVCLEDGKTFKSLKRHLRVHYNMSPEEYREKWGLPADYPMVSPNYAATRSEVARKMGLGQRPRAEPEAEAVEPTAAKPRRGRKPASAEQI